MSTAFLLKNAKITGGSPTDILIEDGLITDIGQGINPGDDCRVIEADGLIALPGMVDLHTHLRQPGLEEAETVWSGTRAAAVGGFSAVHAMANTDPVAHGGPEVEHVLDLAEAANWVKVYPIGSVTKDLAGEELSKIQEMADSRAQVRVFSDDGKCVHDSSLMRKAMEIIREFDGVIAQHSQDPLLTKGAQMDESDLCRQLGLVGWPAVAEEVIVARDVLLAQYLDARIHVCHLSTAGSVAIVRRAKELGIKVTAEATPHHIFLSQQHAAGRDARFKVNPPLRQPHDIEAVQAGLVDGTIDILATDHAPHPAHLKSCRWEDAAFGMTGLETALPVLITTMVRTGRMNWEDVARVTSYNPARIGKDAGQGLPIAVGNPANVILVDPDAVRRIDPQAQYSKSKNTPFFEQELYGHVKYTFVDGTLKVDNGVPVEAA